MSRLMQNFIRTITRGLACSAQATAFREGLPWDPKALQPPREAARKP